MLVHSDLGRSLLLHAGVPIDVTSDLAPALLGSDGSRFGTTSAGKNLSATGWNVLWTLRHGGLFSKMRSRLTVDSRPPWFNQVHLRDDLKNWLLSMEEHSFYLFLYNVLCTKCLSHPSCLPASDREVIFARLQIYGSDLRDELQHFKSFPDLADIGFRHCRRCLVTRSLYPWLALPTCL